MINNRFMDLSCSSTAFLLCLLPAFSRQIRALGLDGWDDDGVHGCSRRHRIGDMDAKFGV
jgi:hypothetical protein